MPKKPKKKRKAKPSKPKKRMLSRPKKGNLQTAPGVLVEGAPLTVPQSTNQSVSPGDVGHWNHPDKE
jgi:hypothetical protein